MSEQSSRWTVHFTICDMLVLCSGLGNLAYGQLFRLALGWIESLGSKRRTKPVNVARRMTRLTVVWPTEGS